MGRWQTPDPAGFTDSVTLYQYVLNNPFRYLDPRGESVLGYICGIAQIFAGAAVMATGVILEVVTFGGYTFAFGFHEAAGITLMANGCAQAKSNARDFKNSSFRKWFWLMG